MATQAMVMTGMPQRVTERAHSQEDWNASLYTVQQRARRGPTPEVFHLKRIDNTRLRAEADPTRAKEIRSFSIAVGILFLLVMVYVVQHFYSIKYGYDIEAQKVTLDKVTEQNRELRLEEAQSVAPSHLDGIAVGLGMQPPVPSQILRQDGAPSSTVPVMAKTTMPTDPATTR